MFINTFRHLKMKNNFPTQELTLDELVSLLGGSVTTASVDLSQLPDKPEVAILNQPTNKRF